MHSKLDQFALIAALSFLLAGCPKQKAPESSGGQVPASGETDPNPELPAESTDQEGPAGSESATTQAPADVLTPTTTLPDGTVTELAVSPTGRIQMVDAQGYPQFDARGEPIWQPTKREIAKQLFDEALMLRKGVAGGPPNLISAASKLQEALSVEPEFHAARYNLGLVWLQLNFFDDALKTLQEVLQQDPDNTDARLALGMTYERLGKLAEAEIAYARGLAKAKDHAGLLNGRARVLLKNEKFAEAEQVAKDILKIDSNSIDAFNTLGLSYMGLEQFERARFAFMKAQSLPDGDASGAVLTNLGLVKLKMGRDFEAREHFEDALRVDPSASSAKVNLAHLMLENLDYEGARRLLEDAMRALPGNIPVKLNLAVALRGTGELERAQTLYEEVAADPSSPYRADAILNLAILQGDALRDYAKAIEHYEEYIALREANGDPVGEDDLVRSYLEEMSKLKKRQDRRREREARKARQAAEEAAEQAGETGQGDAP